MKKLSRIAYLILTLGLTACLHTSNHTNFGSAHHGNNKVIKNNNEEKIVERSDVENRQSTTQYSQAEIINQELIEETTTLVDNLPIKIIDSIPTANIQKVKKKINSIEGEIENVRNSIGHIPVRNQRNIRETNDDEAAAAKTILTVLVIILVVIILIALLTYLLILAFVKSVAESSGCYIATMTYGDYDHPKVKTLRVFRDKFLAKRKWGLKFISFYYKYSPGLVEKLQSKRMINGFIRANLNAFVFVLRKFKF